MKISAITPGKLVLLGEYAVLENSPAIVAAVDRRATITIEQSGQEFSLLKLPHLKESVPLAADQATLKPLVMPKIEASVETVKWVVSMLNRIISKKTHDKDALGGVKLTIDSSDFFTSDGETKLGLGASAAVTVGLLAAVQRFIDSTRPIDRALMYDGYRHHNESQNQAGSGVDIAASVFGGILRYKASTNLVAFSPSIDKISLPDDLQMRFVWTGRPAKTVSFLKCIANFKKNNRSDYIQTMRWLIRLSQSGCRAFKAGDTKKFLETVDRYYDGLDKLGHKSRIAIISNVHRRIAQIVRENGGHYKPSGAGGGDFGVIFSNQQSQIEQIANRVEKAGFSFPKLNVSPVGVCVCGSKEA